MTTVVEFVALWLALLLVLLMTMVTVVAGSHFWDWLRGRREDHCRRRESVRRR